MTIFLEKIAARTYNLACASYSLISIGYYDEALSLVRSIGEIANILSLAVHDEQKFLKWIKSDKGDRIKNFAPAKVRKVLEQSGVPLMNRSWYQTLCESSVHIVPNVQPNNFNDDERNICGGIPQQKGVDTTIDQLTTIVSCISLFYCKYFEFDDYFDLIVKDIDNCK